MPKQQKKTKTKTKVQKGGNPLVIRVGGRHHPRPFRHPHPRPHFRRRPPVIIRTACNIL